MIKNTKLDKFLEKVALKWGLRGTDETRAWSDRRVKLTLSDIRAVMERERGAVSVPGSFGRGGPRHYRPPKSNARFWRDKLEGNRTRDERARRRLNRMGWSVMVVWECDVTRNADAVAARVMLRAVS